MASVRHLFDDSIVLVDDPSLRGSLAGAEAIALPCAASGLDSNVGGDDADYSSVASHSSLSSRLAVGSSGSALGYGTLHLFSIRQEFQRETAWRSAGSAGRQSRATTGHRWNSGARAPSCVPCASVRDVDLERRDGACRVLGADGVRDSHWSADDPDGGRGVGEEVWRYLSRVPQLCSSSPPSSLLARASYNPLWLKADG